MFSLKFRISPTPRSITWDIDLPKILLFKNFTACPNRAGLFHKKHIYIKPSLLSLFGLQTSSYSTFALALESPPLFQRDLFISRWLLYEHALGGETQKTNRLVVKLAILTDWTLPAKWILKSNVWYVNKIYWLGLCKRFLICRHKWKTQVFCWEWSFRNSKHSTIWLWIPDDMI